MSEAPVADLVLHNAKVVTFAEPSPGPGATQSVAVKDGRGRLPTRAELDAAAPGNPVYLRELCDRAVLNSAALARCGWDGAAADPPGGRLLRDAAGALTGEVRGTGAFAVPSTLASTADGLAGLEEEVRGTAAMMAAFAGHGLAGVVDGGGMATVPSDYDALYELWRRGGLPVRTRLFLCGVCGSDVKIARGQMGFSASLPLPDVAGHEIVGVIAEAGRDAQVRPGTRVVVYGKELLGVPNVMPI